LPSPKKNIAVPDVEIEVEEYGWREPHVVLKEVDDDPGQVSSACSDAEEGSISEWVHLPANEESQEWHDSGFAEKVGRYAMSTGGGATLVSQLEQSDSGAGRNGEFMYTEKGIDWDSLDEKPFSSAGLSLLRSRCVQY
jgi:hypothetical protein